MDTTEKGILARDERECVMGGSGEKAEGFSDRNDVEAGRQNGKGGRP
jgi:hypothetical protein